MVELFDAFCPSGPGIERRKMFGYPCFFVNGRLAGGLHGRSFLLHLAEADRAKLANIGGEIFSPMPGRTMKEYAVLPTAILDDRAQLADWIDRAIAYCSSLPEKTKKR